MCVTSFYDATKKIVRQGGVAEHDEVAEQDGVLHRCDRGNKVDSREHY